MYTKFKSALLFPLVLLSACQENPSSTSVESSALQATVVKTEVLATTIGSKALHQTSVGNLALTEKQGLMLNGTKLGLKPSREKSERLTSEGLEFLEAVSSGNENLYVSFDTELKQPALVSVTEQHAEISTANLNNDVSVEGLCAIRTSATRIDLILLGEDAVARHVLIQQKNEASDDLAAWEFYSLREFNLPPSAEYCAIDSLSQQVLINEEGVAIWGYPLNPEAELKRSVIDVVAPFGSIAHSASALMVVEGNLLTFDLESPQLNHYRYEEEVGQYTYHNTVQLDKALEVEFIKAELVEKTLTLSVYDDMSEGFFKVELNDINAVSLTASLMKQIPAIVETPPMTTGGDAADDPAIWLNAKHPENSRVLATNKKYGLHVYDLAGKQTQELVVGRINNVDVRHGFSLNGSVMDIAAASHRDHNSIALFSIDPLTGVVASQGEITTTLSDVYGLCMAKLNDQHHVFINDQDGRYQQYQIVDTDSSWSGKLVREFKVKSQPEGCTSFDEQGVLFVGEEDVGIWTLDLTNSESELQKIAAINSDTLVDDVEGMDLYLTEQQQWLVVSSQGNDSYVILNAHPPHKMVGRFQVALNPLLQIDGASETDGLAVTSTNLGGEFSAGLLVVQDGRNVMPSEKQNFKYVAMKDVLISMESAE